MSDREILEEVLKLLEEQQRSLRGTLSPEAAHRYTERSQQIRTLLHFALNNKPRPPE